MPRIMVLLVAPSRVRGLKQTDPRLQDQGHRVAPSRVRGLKLYIYTPRLFLCRGRTFTGAWIETFPAWTLPGTCPGRTFTGAWIETSMPS